MSDQVGVLILSLVIATPLTVAGLYYMRHSGRMQAEMDEEARQAPQGPGLLARLDWEYLQFLASGYRRRMWYTGLAMIVMGIVAVVASLVKYFSR